MSRANGYLTIQSHDGARLVEIDTITCCHCQRIVPLNKADGTKLAPPAFCLRCVAPQCPVCAATERCAPFEAELERVEARQRSLRSMGFK